MIRNGNWYNGKEIYKILNLAITSFELEQQCSAIDPKNITRRGQKGGGVDFIQDAEDERRWFSGPSWLDYIFPNFFCG